ncbi:hypothetical protein KAU11_00370 [Candidatus Babeliales bacterium]|nr:hypothetical protein [Candidatus Babeliales bacterium]
MNKIILDEDEKQENIFVDWAEENGINMDDEKDWKPWWNCWHAGYKVGWSVNADRGYDNALSDASAAIEELKQR